MNGHDHRNKQQTCAAHSPKRRSSHVAPHGSRNEVTARQKSHQVHGSKYPARNGQRQLHMAGARTAVLAILDQVLTLSTTSEAQKGPLTWENVPKVGLEPDSSPCKHWTPAKTCGIRPGPAPVRPDPQPRVCTLCTRQLRRFKLSNHRPQPAARNEGMRFFCVPTNNPRLHPGLRPRP
jgi:hypothetical protein